MHIFVHCQEPTYKPEISHSLNFIKISSYGAGIRSQGLVPRIPITYPLDYHDEDKLIL